MPRQRHHRIEPRRLAQAGKDVTKETERNDHLNLHAYTASQTAPRRFFEALNSRGSVQLANLPPMALRFHL